MLAAISFSLFIRNNAALRRIPSNLSLPPRTFFSSQTDGFSETIFDKILRREILAKVLFEDDKCLAFADVTPQAPVHILLIPKIRDGLTQLQKAEEKHKEILGHLLYTVSQIAKEQGLQEGYRVVINDGKLGCQSVYHLHLHIIGGTQLGWPPGVLGKQEVIKPGTH